MQITMPKLFFIGRKALADKKERVEEALRMTPIQTSFAVHALDAKLAEGLNAQVVGFNAPVAIVADFPFEIAYIDDNGSLVPGELPEITNEPEHNNSPAGS